MSKAVEPIQFRRELAHRSGCGLEVTLYWHPKTNAVTVCVVDVEHQDYFEIDVAPEYALAVFHHPFLYVDEPDCFEQAA
jgi:hypothetical protein